MTNSFSIRASDNIATLMNAPEPVVALNLMGVSLLSAKWFDPNRSIFWIDGIMGSAMCKIARISIRRMPGRDLLAQTIAHIGSNMADRPIAIIGANQEVVKMAALLGRKPMQLDMPWIQSREQAAKLNFSGLTTKHIVFLAIGSPKQEWVANAIFSNVGAKCFCVGGAVNMLEGRERAAPVFFQKFGIEWLYRLGSDPKRRLTRLFSSLPNGIKNLRHARSMRRLY
jgi:exopolysaccharide biosynthesis WecB/TagA/CpsF family protein